VKNGAEPARRLRAGGAPRVSTCSAAIPRTPCPACQRPCEPRADDVFSQEVSAAARPPVSVRRNYRSPAQAPRRSTKTVLAEMHTPSYRRPMPSSAVRRVRPNNTRAGS